VQGSREFSTLLGVRLQKFNVSIISPAVPATCEMVGTRHLFQNNHIFKRGAIPTMAERFNRKATMGATL
jgi:hypothetical protein